MADVRYWHDQQSDLVIMQLSRETDTITVRFTSAQLDVHIAEMGRLRAAMREPVSATAPVSLEAQVNPAWTMSDQRERQGVGLMVRHSGFGWLGFRFPDHEAQRIGHWLTELYQNLNDYKRRVDSQSRANVESPRPTTPHREAGPAGWGSGTASSNANSAGWQGFGSGTGGGGGASGP
ncbi:MAG: hypothetical protein JO061_03835 [Acidobacteriaceae bacterium]|nr:hypothetical protein [Acidobacteriaceae bacterium]